MRRIGAAVIFTVLIGTSGCSRWSDARQEQTTIQHIDAQISIGMAESDFKSAFPDAEPWRVTARGTDYLVTVTKPCLVCYSAAAFMRSRDVFARNVRFESEQLVAIDPVEILK